MVFNGLLYLCDFCAYLFAFWIDVVDCALFILFVWDLFYLVFPLLCFVFVYVNCCCCLL